ncbi:MAG: hypothetical protein JHD19_10250 [Pseudomonas sp.]|uniref:ead/Ea22-like family protein n=1 Tax=Pseudomonas sp. TaxID=306 RepID=UPI001A2C87C3|nr:ead/Ea22-like family protein [Pseudomonas sp.]MBJ7371814.1 hypothetical protein [Pseudomonas sp.]
MDNKAQILDLAKLKRVAEAATSGPWERGDGNEVMVSEEGDEAYWSWEQAGPAQIHGSGNQPIADADFIAAANPAAVLALIAEIERLTPFQIVAATFLEKTEWVQTSAQPHELGQHRADILKARIEALECK